LRSSKNIRNSNCRISWIIRNSRSSFCRKWLNTLTLFNSRISLYSRIWSIIISSIWI